MCECGCKNEVGLSAGSGMRKGWSSRYQVSTVSNLVDVRVCMSMC